MSGQGQATLEHTHEWVRLPTPAAMSDIVGQFPGHLPHVVYYCAGCGWDETRMYPEGASEPAGGPR